MRKVPFVCPAPAVVALRRRSMDGRIDQSRLWNAAAPRVAQAPIVADGRVIVTTSTGEVVRSA